jgi:hypothetical protein
MGVPKALLVSWWLHVAVRVHGQPHPDVCIGVVLPRRRDSSKARG